MTEDDAAAVPMPSIVRSPPTASSITSHSVASPSPSNSTSSSRRSASATPGRFVSSCVCRSAPAETILNPREPDEKVGLTETSRSG